MSVEPEVHTIHATSVKMRCLELHLVLYTVQRVSVLGLFLYL